jgi:glucose/arabinose dehydrogenase
MTPPARASRSHLVRSALVGALVAATALGLTAVAPSAGAAGLPDPIPGRIPLSSFSLGLRPLATGLVSPDYATTAPGVPDRLYVVDQVGKIWAVDTSSRHYGQRRLFADLSSVLVRLGDVQPGTQYDERGLLGLAFAPDYQRSGLLYTYQTEPYTRRADFSTEPGNAQNCRAYSPAGTRPFRPRPCQNVVTEWRVRDPHDPDTTVVASSVRELLRIDKPFYNHNGGTLAFGPDGYLYLSLGDGGFGDDQGPGHVPGGNAQSLAAGDVLGKILRIDPRGHDAANGRYGIPPGNPFVGRRGADEIWAYGLRNPYRISFDAVTGRLYAADTGQDNVEEVDVIHRGANYGWRVTEGTFAFHPGSPTSADDSWVTRAGATPGLTDPIAEYDHTGPNGTVNGEATVGGFVYRGSALPQLAGRYVFGDYSRAADTFGPAARLWYVNGNPDPRHAVTAIRVDGRPALHLLLLGFGQDSSGELYVMGNTNGQVTGRSGVVYRLVQR